MGRIPSYNSIVERTSVRAGGVHLGGFPFQPPPPAVGCPYPSEATGGGGVSSVCSGNRRLPGKLGIFVSWRGCLNPHTEVTKTSRVRIWTITIINPQNRFGGCVIEEHCARVICCSCFLDLFVIHAVKLSHMYPSSPKWSVQGILALGISPSPGLHSLTASSQWI